MTIIDVRCRLTTAGAAEYFKAYRKPSMAVQSGTAEAFFEELDAAGVTTAVSVSGNNPGLTLGHRTLPSRTTANDDQAEMQRRYPGRFIGVGGIDVSNTVHDGMAELERCVNQLGLRAVSIEPGRAPLHVPNPADPRLYPFYTRTQELGVTLFLQTSGLWGGKNIDYAHPRWVDQVAEDFPDLHIICGHGCYPYVREAIVLALRRDNVWVSPDFYSTWPGAHDWVRAAEISKLADKFLFGSAFPAGGPLRESVKKFLALDWHPAVLDRILYRNALKALQLEHDANFKAMAEQPDVYNRGSLRRRLKRLLHQVRG